MVDLEFSADDAGPWTQDARLAGLAMGMMAAFNCLAEAMVDAKIIEPSRLAGVLEAKIEELQAGSHELNRPAETRDMLTVLRGVTRPLRSAERAATRLLLREPPLGSA